VNRALPEVRAAQCVRYRYRYSDCTRCVDACPHGAVRPTDAGIDIDPGVCRNCALCTSACRTGAVVSGNLDRIELLRRAIKHESFTIACAPSGLRAEAIVPCLGALDAVTLAYLSKRGIDTELRGASGCIGCPQGARGAAQLHANLDAVSSLAGAAAPEPWRPIRLADDGPGHPSVADQSHAMARRQLFRRLVGRGIDAVAAGGGGDELLPVAEKAIRPGPYAVTDQRELLRIVAGRVEGRALRLPAHEAIPLIDLELSDGCTACEACFRACPTGAIAIEESESSWTLAFDAQRCVGCEVCVEVCQPKVLRASAVAEVTSVKNVRALHRLAKQRCVRCDRFFVSHRPRESCGVCEDDAEAFAQIFG
jgi:ferredoxin